MCVSTASTATTPATTEDYTDSPSTKYNKNRKKYRESLRPLRKKFATEYARRVEEEKLRKFSDDTKQKEEKLIRDKAKFARVTANRKIHEEMLRKKTEERKGRKERIAREKRDPFLKKMEAAKFNYVKEVAQGNTSWITSMADLDAMLGDVGHYVDDSDTSESDSGSKYSTSSKSEEFWARPGSVLGAPRATGSSSSSASATTSKTFNAIGIGAGPVTEDIRKSFGSYFAFVTDPRHRIYPVGDLYDDDAVAEGAVLDGSGRDEEGRDSMLYQTLLNRSRNSTRASIVVKDMLAEATDGDEEKLREMMETEGRGIDELKSIVMDFEMDSVKVTDGEDRGDMPERPRKIPSDRGSWQDDNEGQAEAMIGVPGKGVYKQIIFARPDKAKDEKDWVRGPTAAQMPEE